MKTINEIQNMAFFLSSILTLLKTLNAFSSPSSENRNPFFCFVFFREALGDTIYIL